MASAPHVAAPDTPIVDVHRVMRLAGIRHVPVVEAGKLVGVVSERDVLASWTNGGATVVERVMTRSPRWIAEDAPAREAASVLLRYKIGCLPVLDARRVVVGIVTATNFLELAHRALTPEAMRAPTAPS